MLRLVILFLAVVAAVLLVHWLLKEDPKKLAGYLKRGAMWGAVAVLVALAATGRLHWLFALIAAAVPFAARLLSLLRYVPILSHLYTQVQNARAARGVGSTSASGQTSQVESRYLRMSLNHDTGQMDGEVLVGAFQGKRLSELGLEQLMQFFKECDDESRALLQAYLDRVHGDIWREQAGSWRQGTESTSPTGKMDLEEAREVLGVAKDADREQIIDAHRRLMQKLHPDRGGSTYLAAKINQAKDVLLAQDN